MPSVLDITQIPAPRVAFIDPRTNLMSREWYMFFLNIYNLAGGGSSAASISDILVSPETTVSVSQFMDVYDKLQAEALSPVCPDSSTVYAALQGLALQPANTPQKANLRYGVFSDTTTQTAAAINTAYAMTLNTTAVSVGVYTGTPTSRIYVDRPGWYNFQFSAQLTQTTGAAHNVYIWADINGTSQANTATQVTLAGSSAAAVAAWNFVLFLNAGDYFRLMWSTDNTSCYILAAAAAPPVPAIPSVILTVTDNIGNSI